MKKIALQLFSLGVLAISFAACDDAKNDAIDNRVYIQEASTRPLGDLVMGDEGSVMSAPITLRVANELPHDVKIKLALSQSNLDDYNKRNQTTYEMVPAEYVEFPTEVIIKAGEYSSTVPVQITSFKGEGGVDYAVSIGIVSTEGLEATATTKAFIYALAAPLKQPVPSFRYNNGCRLQPSDTDWNLALTNYTLEYWVRVTGTYNVKDGYSINNQAIFANSDSPELYIRFGDLIYTNEYGGYAKNFMQVKTMGGQFDSGNPNDNKGLVSGDWYHFAIAYDASTGTTKMYKNGSEISKLTTATGVALPINHLNMFDSGSAYFHDNVEMCQVRLWSVTRSADQISNFMRKEVKYNDPNLIFYLPMNEGEGATVLKDVTGNGHDMKIGVGGVNGTRNTAYAWNEYDFSSL